MSVRSGRVMADGQVFDAVNFIDAEIVFSGGHPPTFMNCKFEGSRLLFEGSADSTLRYLRALAGASPEFRDVVLSMIPELNAPTPAND